MFGRKSQLIAHYEGEITRLRQRVSDLEHRNSVLVDRLLAKHDIPPAVPEVIPQDLGSIDRLAIFEDIDSPKEPAHDVEDNRRGDHYDAFAG